MPPPSITLPPGLCICRKPECAIAWGTCHCGCGEKTSIAKQGSLSQGWVKGVPVKYIKRHQNRIPRDWGIKEKIIDGSLAHLVPLGRNRFLIIDPESTLKIKGSCYCGNNGYAYLSQKGFKSTLVHRVIVDASAGDIVDHINRNRLDCRLCNLRIVTSSQNMRNRCAQSRSISGYKNVSRIKSTRYPNYEIYGVRIKVGKSRKSFGYFKKAIDAALHADKVNYLLFGNFACLNFPYQLSLTKTDNKQVETFCVAESSVIKTIAYDGMGTLATTLHSGKTYGHIGISFDVFKEFRETKSKGEFWNNVVRSQYLSIGECESFGISENNLFISDFKELMQ